MIKAVNAYPTHVKAMIWDSESNLEILKEIHNRKGEFRYSTKNSPNRIFLSDGMLSLMDGDYVLFDERSDKIFTLAPEVFEIVYTTVSEDDHFSKDEVHVFDGHNADTKDDTERSDDGISYEVPNLDDITNSVRNTIYDIVDNEKIRNVAQRGKKAIKTTRNKTKGRIHEEAARYYKRKENHKQYNESTEQHEPSENFEDLFKNSEVSEKMKNFFERLNGRG